MASSIPDGYGCFGSSGTDPDPKLLALLRSDVTPRVSVLEE